MILLRQRQFARRDYVGLDETAKKALKDERSRLAEELLRKRSKANQAFDEGMRAHADATKFIHDFTTANPKAALSDEAFDKAVNKLPIHNQRAVREVVLSSEGAKGKIEVNRSLDYNTALFDARDDAGFARDKALKDTERRARIAAVEEQAAKDEAARAAKKASAETTKNVRASKGKGFVSKNLGRVKRLYTGTSKYGKAGQIAAIGTTALGVGALGYGTYKAVKNKNDKNK